LLDFDPDYPYLTARRFEMASRRLLNISVRPGSRAHEAYYSSARSSARALTADELAAGFQPHPELNITFRGGRTITDLVFANRYVGGAGNWDAGDIANIDNGLAKALTDSGLQTVVEQYYRTPISSRMLPSAVLPDPAPGRIYKDQAEALVAQLYGGGLAGADPATTVINLMLPRGTVLLDGFSRGFRPAAGEEAEHRRREAAVVRIDDDAADSLHGLGGYHGSVHLTASGADVVVYYAVGVYSEGQNGIAAFDQPWKNVVATFYHELNEARTDTDVEEAIRTGDNSKLGWYSDQDGEIGDIPIDEAGDNLGLVFQEVQLADGSGTVPVQLLWSNADGGPASHVP
jgi:hypothetical protein